MRILAPSVVRTLLSSPSRRGAGLMAAGTLALALVAAAGCGGDDDPEGSQAAGSAQPATATASPEAPEPTVPVGTLVPLPTHTAVPGATATPAGTGAQARVVEMTDLVPCMDQTYFVEQTLPNGVHALTYTNVPEGTSILFPFEDGRLRNIDAREGAILLTYDVEDVGVLSIQAAGTNTLDRNIAHATRGEVIGHFAGTFGGEETDVFEDHQLFAIVGSEEMVQVGDTLISGEGLDPEITDCIVLP